jgi:hypothetical protein
LIKPQTTCLRVILPVMPTCAVPCHNLAQRLDLLLYARHL